MNSSAPPEFLISTTVLSTIFIFFVGITYFITSLMTIESENKRENKRTTYLIFMIFGIFTGCLMLGAHELIYWGKPTVTKEIIRRMLDCICEF